MKQPNSTFKSKAQRRKDAEERAVERAKLSAKQQLARLDSLFGKGKGAKKERARLKKLVKQEQA